jgi:hypothetical protein
MLRPVRLKVLDEVKNGISYFDETFFTELPRLYIQVDAAASTSAIRKKTGRCRPSSGSAAGSAATATATPSSPPRSCAKPCACNRCSAQLLPRRSPRTRSRTAAFRLLVKVTPELQALAELDRPFAAAPRRALPPGADRHLRPPRSDRQRVSTSTSRSATKSVGRPNLRQPGCHCAPTSRCWPIR